MLEDTHAFSKIFLFWTSILGQFPSAKKCFPLNQSRQSLYICKTAHILGNTNVLKIISREKSLTIGQILVLSHCVMWYMKSPYMSWIEQQWRFHLHDFFSHFQLCCCRSEWKSWLILRTINWFRICINFTFLALSFNPQHLFFKISPFLQFPASVKKSES